METTTETHKVAVVFGEGADEGPDLWFGLRSATRNKGLVRVQWLRKVEERDDDVYELTTECQNFKRDAIEYEFDGVVFIKTTTFRITKAGRR